MRNRLSLTLTALCLLPLFALAQVPLRTINDLRTSPADYPSINPEELADSIVIFVPDADFWLHIPEDFDRTLRGQVVEVLKGVVPGEISFGADRFTRDIRKGMPVKMFLMEYPEKFDVYYPIAIAEVNGGVQ